jgi:outer membrane protein OmpU
MKKVLFATTALVAFAGVAAADVTITGGAEMGIVGGDALGTGADAGTVVSSDAAFWTHVDVVFTLSGTTDNGLTFGASVDLDEAAGIAGVDGTDNVAIFVSGDFGALTMGDTDSAMDWAMIEADFGNAGSIADNETAHAGYDGDYGDQGQYLRYDYSVAGFGFAISVQPENTSDNYALGLRYATDFAGGSLTVGFGYQRQETLNGRWAPGNLGTFFDIANGGDGVDVGSDACDSGGFCDPGDGDGLRNDTGIAGGTQLRATGISVGVELDSGLSASLGYTDWDIGGFDATHTAVAIAYSMDALTVSANYGVFDFGGGDEISGFGLAAAYDLGGGLSAHFGYGNSDFGVPGATSVDNYSLGLSMSF